MKTRKFFRHWVDVEPILIRSAKPLEEMMSEDRPSRRSFVDWILGAGITGSLASFLYPVLKFVIPPPVAEAIELNVVAATVEELPPNTAKIFKFGRR
ncbi:MAG TPA: hypothetical protein VGC53_08490, partial [Vicinamibacteria bacterium]